MKEPRNLPTNRAGREIELARHSRSVPRSRSPESASKVNRSGMKGKQVGNNKNPIDDCGGGAMIAECLHIQTWNTHRPNAGKSFEVPRTTAHGFAW